MSLFYNFKQYVKNYKSFISLATEHNTNFNVQNIKNKEQLENLIIKLLETAVETKDTQFADSLNHFLDIILLCLKRAEEKHQNQQAKQALDYIESEKNKLSPVQVLFQWLLDKNIKQVIVDNLWEAYLEQDTDLFVKLIDLNKTVVDLMLSQAKGMEWQRVGVVLMNFVMALMQIDYTPGNDAELKRVNRQKYGIPAAPAGS